jgi:radical SAM protein with 4Fe4S-binding SPASM domain
VKIKESPRLKLLQSKEYNYIFNKNTGLFLRWGKTQEENPIFSQYGPEILDLELSTICHQGCEFCYKSNGINGSYMTFEIYRKILDKMPKILTQVAFGIGDVDSNPDLKKIVEYTRKKEVIPNITINGFRMGEKDWQWFAQNFGAIAISNYEEDACYGAVKKLTDLGMKQVNIHQLLSEETYEKCFSLLKDAKADKRLEKLNAIVFLSLKKKGRGEKFNIFENKKKYKELIDFAMYNKIGIGFDSCGAGKFLEAIKFNKNYNELEKLVEPCESSLFSAYIDVNGKYYPCSFCEGINEWGNGINVIKSQNFLKEVWMNKKTKEFREKMLKCIYKNKCRKCVMYEV